MIELSCFSWVQLIKKTKMPSGAKLIALYLSTFMNHEHDIAWPSQKRISYETGLSEPTVRKWLSYLNNNQWLIVRKKNKLVTIGNQQYQHNEYLINIPEQRVSDLLSGVSRGKTIDEQRVNESRAEGKQLTTNNNRITSNNNTATSDDLAFSVFWDQYPKKTKKKYSERAWNNLTKTKKEKAIFDCKTRYKETEKKYIPDPTTYIHGERWNDEIVETKTNDNSLFEGAL